MNERSSFPDRPRDETERSFLEGRDYNMKKLVKTNVMRLLDAAKIAYEAKEYPVDENDLSGSHAADLMGVDHGSVFKTLVLRGEKTGYMVCCIPVDGEVDLKKAARSVGEKSVEMIHVKDITKITGYVRGGCSPLGMKKLFPTVIDESAKNFAEIYVSGGRIGLTLKVPLSDLLKVTGGKLADITA